MGLDPNIILSYRPPAIQLPHIATPLEQFAKILNLRQLMQQGQMSGLQIEQLQRQMAAQEAINQDLQRGAPNTGIPTRPMGGGAVPGSVPLAPLPADPFRLPEGAAPALEPTTTWPTPGPAPTSPVTPPFLPSGGGATVAPGPTAVAGLAPTSVVTPPFLPRVAGTPGGGMSLQDLMSRIPQLLQKGGVYALPTIQSIAAAAKADLDQQKAALEVHSGQADEMSKMVSGSVDNESFQRNLWKAGGKGYATPDEVNLYGGLGFDNPRTQKWLESKGLEAYKYGDAIKVLAERNAEARKTIEFGQTQEAQARADAWTGAQAIPADTWAAKVKWLTEQSPYIQKLYGGLVNLPLDQLQMIVGNEAQKAEAGKTVPYLAPIQTQKEATMAAQGYLGAIGKQVAENQQWQAVADKVKSSANPNQAFANLPEDYKLKVGPLLAQQGGITQFLTKPTDAEMGKVYDLQRGISVLQDLKTKITDPKNEWITGPTFGHIKDLPWSTQAKDLAAQMDLVRATVKDMISRGTLSVRNLPIYENMFPKMTDPTEHIKHNLDLLLTTLQNDAASYHELLRSSGRALPDTVTAPAPSVVKPPPPKIGDRREYNGQILEFVGTDPKDPSNWHLVTPGK